ncbi:hypothetical protein PUNSTDRAFT_134880 [Punctularia strigosozonata HHB-11173 SS5]|uniref:uncharacterized protein n=1 Tax=Punctularia strigosozonata (strain HHB-11173) TaxID=741275 RepID=UPI0004417E15|nr:uncharacterized protein PUNSTDRAFT_134880 [Punctularia strigosozonata HHB-11173 SS5]EIN08502.1 hypothetical protein PUNSTDRAFT_134880 [Punctularia strigosozonata HHB-11173 SS5]
MTSPSQQFTCYRHLHFVGANPSILHCDVVDSQGTAHYRVQSNVVNGILLTTVTDAANRTLALIDWQNNPAVEISGFLGRTSVAEWLERSPDLRARYMEVGKVRYTWQPVGNCIYLTIQLSADLSTPPHILCRVSKTGAEVSLELDSDASRLGIELPAAVATIVLMSGRNID